MHSDAQWTIDPETGADVWTPQEPAILPTGCPQPTIAELATLAGSKETVSRACGVRERTVG